MTVCVVCESWVCSALEYAKGLGAEAAHAQHINEGVGEGVKRDSDDVCEQPDVILEELAAVVTVQEVFSGDVYRDDVACVVQEDRQIENNVDERDDDDCDGGFALHLGDGGGATRDAY